MSKLYLQNIVDDISFENLPAKWQVFDFARFSEDKVLFDFQQNALKNALKGLWLYFKGNAPAANEVTPLQKENNLKQSLFNLYKTNGFEENFDYDLKKKAEGKTAKYLLEYPEDYPSVDNKISFAHFINRMSFWMATGSGKSLIIIKLVEILAQLMGRKEIPPYDILILTHRDDLIEQLKKHVDEFNYANETKIILKELKEYPEVKRQRTLFDTTVFYYRSDNLSDEQKEKIIDFKNYDNDGKWYIFLDEAHKGDREDSKRQQIYSVLSRNGFLFNSSATFIDSRDIATCAFEFNLSSFVNAGYGKHINILKQEIRAFRDEEDYSGDEKQKIVLKSLILLTYVKKFYQDIKNIQPDLYHNPLLLALVNSVNKKDADLKLFFRELERIGKGEIDPGVLKIAIDELWDELKDEPEFMFEEGIKIKVDETILKSITKDDILRYVYNSNGSGETEVLVRQSNRKELAFKLKTSDKPFALIKIGDTLEWLKEELAGYEVQERFEDEGYFESLNKEESEINILMGSRSFYEGWDSNRPNVINFINIGGEDAKKFILQSIGRGVRIEPIKNKRKRLLQLYNSKEIDQNLFDKVKDKVLPIETLFIFGTNRNALTTVVQELKTEKEGERKTSLSLFENPQIQKDKLLVPKYRPADSPLLKTDKQVKFEISAEDLEVLSEFGEFITDDRVILMRYNTEPKKVKFLRESLRTQNDFKTGEKSFKDVDLLIQRFFDYLSVTLEEFEKFKELEEEIRHFKNIKVYLEDISELQEKIEKVSQFKDPSQLDEELKEKYNRREISLEEYTEGIKKNARMVKEEKVEYKGKQLKIKYVANHYYLPIILSDDEKVDYIKHIINVNSEVKFINDLEDYLERPDNKFKDFDWWFFSKLDESLDEIYIPYYNPNVNTISKFYPDFIFWFKKGNNYFIVFVDPKGIKHIDYQYKIDGYRLIFESNNGGKKEFLYDGSKLKVYLLLRTDDINKVSQGYKQYWFDKIEEMLKVIA